MKLKEISKVLFLLLVIAVIVIPKVSLADSGFDYSYGGGSSSSGGSWGGGSYSSHDYSSHSSSSYSYGGSYTYSDSVVYIIYIIVVIFVFLVITTGSVTKKNKYYSGVDPLHRLTEDDSKIDNSVLIDKVINDAKKINPNITRGFIYSLIRENYIKYQKAFTERNITELRKLTSDNLFIFLQERITRFNNNKTYQVIEDINVEQVDINKMNIIDKVANLEVSLSSIEKNYYIDDKSNIVKGSSAPMHAYYKLGLDIDLENEKVIFNTKLVDFNFESKSNNEIDYEELLKINPSLTKDNILDNTYKIYEELQYAWSNFNYEGMRKVISDELYNNYKVQLDTLKMKNQRNVMEDIELISGKVVSTVVHSNVISFKVEMTVRQVDYIADSDGKLLRGDKNTHTCTYELFVEKGISSAKTNCPNCGASISDAASKTCESCGANLIDVSNNFIIVKKTMLKQR